jgi:hypothetical protein
MFREPLALVKETNGISSTASADPTIVHITDDQSLAEITAVTCFPVGNFAICGKDDGAVALYSTSTGEEICILHRHAKGIAVSIIDCCDDATILVSTDISSRILVHGLVRTDHALSVFGPLLDERVRDLAITQTLLSQDGRFLLPSTSVSDVIYDLETGSCGSTDVFNRTSCKWVNHPSDTSRLINTTPEFAEIHTWSEISESHQSSYNRLALAPSINIEAAAKSVAAYSNGSKLIIEFAKRRGLKSTVEVMVLSTNSFDAPYSQTPLSTLPAFSRLVPHIEHVIGSIGHTLFFLNRQMWVCSLDLESPKNGYTQHCCIPDEWISANGSIILKVTPSSNFVFVKRGEIAVIQGAREFKHWIPVGDA